MEALQIGYGWGLRFGYFQLERFKLLIELLLHDFDGRQHFSFYASQVFPKFAYSRR